MNEVTASGHGPGRGISGKSEFPNSLSDVQIIVGIETIANDSASYPGGVMPSGGGRVKISGVIQGVRTTVIVDPDRAEVISAWPEGVPRNP